MILESNKLVEIITSKIKSIVIIINPDGELLYVSQSVKRILGYEPYELLGSHWWKATRKDESSAYKMIDQFKFWVKEKKMEELSSERLLFTSENKKIWILWNSSFDEEGNVVSVGYDITNRKINEQRLSRTVKLLKNKNREITDSINYAQSIQHSILPNSKILSNYFTEHFVFFQPKDIVSGDFYFFYEWNNLFFVACIDCTGHGVPGALMTVLANNLLKTVIKHHQMVEPSEILNTIDHLLYDEFNKNKKIKRADGMDISLCVFDFSQNKLKFSGANHSVLIYRNKEEFEFKGNRYPIGLYHDVIKKFNTYEFDFAKGDKFVLFSDGITDQFGGKDFYKGGKKYTKKRFKDLIRNSKSTSELKTNLENQFYQWKNKLEQTDDVLVIVVEI
ncbi:MAG: SpoIIE family protein phosphatase [Flavobacteriia bacterium]|nr:SpoIIE family protein phosphatase [Flavobacteriia bacterium]